MATQLAHDTPADPAAVLGKATVRAGQRLGLSREALAQTIGRDRSSISRSGIAPESKSGELAALLVRCYRSLAVLLGDDVEQVKAWMSTHNTHVGGRPIELVQSVGGLVTVCSYLDAIRGHG